LSTAGLEHILQLVQSLESQRVLCEITNSKSNIDFLSLFLLKRILSIKRGALVGGCTKTASHE
jgi:hypothetical protein